MRTVELCPYRIDFLGVRGCRSQTRLHREWHELETVEVSVATLTVFVDYAWAAPGVWTRRANARG
ncbi:hypothetical protein RW1_038_00050 [Rhodococcus wratislaviensis NBRC 100605]|uniref:Uncharacterized protein n=1 Tax=Rhodococcus wratislaviensis NBRC 100605 TaxID=1219028 RepID=X0Q6U4_RHOWR|nr:hypothetical protein RW1_038_00050 [Rhodococcus wratislaviensis NBRC 100605]